MRCSRSASRSWASPDLLDGHDVAQRLRHLLAAEVHHPGVQPVPRERTVAEGPFGLGKLVFVVREDQVRAAAVDVERFAEVAVRHRRTFDVPPRAAGTPRAVPRRLARLGALPQREVERAVLLLAHLDARARAQVLDALLRERAVVRELGDGEVHVARGGVRQPARLEMADDLQHLGNVLGRARLDVRRLHVQRRQVLVHEPRVVLGHLRRRAPLELAALDDLVVDVGDVADERDRVARRAQVPGDDVERHHHARVADVTAVVDRDAARVHPDPPLFQRNERDLLSSAGVVNP